MLQMFDKGFCNIDAIDASSKMLEEAKKLNIYTNFYCTFIGPSRLDIEDSK